MRRAAGILFLAPDNTALFLKRGNGGDHPNEFCFPGGTQEEGETALQCAEREAIEELGFLPEGTRTEWTRRIKADWPINPVTPLQEVVPTDAPPPQPAAPPEEVDFTTYLQRVKEKFEPKTNGEHTGWGWFSIQAPPEPLHPGCRVALARFDMDETGVAQAMANGELTSPQQYQNVTLFAMRITGTGFSYRPQLNEFVYRRPENYLTPEFMARCNGLPVIMLHPGEAILNSKEFGERIVGTMTCPYIQGDEVWGIARIYDSSAIKLLSTKELSTSPGVVLASGSKKMELEDGATLLLEEKASLLDHLAICEHGVWDKGEGPNGIESTTAEEHTMTDEEKKAAEEKARKDAAEAEEAKKRADAESGNIDKILKCVDSMMTTLDTMGKRMDAMDEDRKADRARMDALETESVNDKAKKDAEEEEKKKADAARKDAEEKEEEEKKKADAARADSINASVATAALAKRVEEVAARLPLDLSEEDTAKFATVQARADDVYHALGTAAPRALTGEGLLAYRRRLLSKLQPMSKTWKDVDMLKVNDSVSFDIMENQILSDAMANALSPVTVPEGRLREIVRRDTTGRQIKTFVGRPKDWMRTFTLPPQYLTKIVKDPVQ